MLIFITLDIIYIVLHAALPYFDDKITESNGTCDCMKDLPSCCYFKTREHLDLQWHYYVHCMCFIIMYQSKSKMIPLDQRSRSMNGLFSVTGWKVNERVKKVILKDFLLIILSSICVSKIKGGSVWWSHQYRYL